MLRSIREPVVAAVDSDTWRVIQYCP